MATDALRGLWVVEHYLPPGATGWEGEVVLAMRFAPVESSLRQLAKRVPLQAYVPLACIDDKHVAVAVAICEELPQVHPLSSPSTSASTDYGPKPVRPVGGLREVVIKTTNGTTATLPVTIRTYSLDPCSCLSAPVTPDGSEQRGCDPTATRRALSVVTAPAAPLLLAADKLGTGGVDPAESHAQDVQHLVLSALDPLLPRPVGPGSFSASVLNKLHRDVVRFNRRNCHPKHAGLHPPLGTPWVVAARAVVTAAFPYGLPSATPAVHRLGLSAVLDDADLRPEDIAFIAAVADARARPKAVPDSSTIADGSSSIATGSVAGGSDAPVVVTLDQVSGAFYGRSHVKDVVGVATHFYIDTAYPLGGSDSTDSNVRLGVATGRWGAAPGEGDEATLLEGNPTKVIELAPSVATRPTPALLRRLSRPAEASLAANGVPKSRGVEVLLCRPPPHGLTMEQQFSGEGFGGDELINAASVERAGTIEGIATSLMFLSLRSLPPNSQRAAAAPRRVAGPPRPLLVGTAAADTSVARSPLVPALSMKYISEAKGKPHEVHSVSLRLRVALDAGEERNNALFNGQCGSIAQFSANDDLGFDEAFVRRKPAERALGWKSVVVPRMAVWILLKDPGVSIVAHDLKQSSGSVSVVPGGGTTTATGLLWEQPGWTKRQHGYEFSLQGTITVARKQADPIDSGSVLLAAAEVDAVLVPVSPDQAWGAETADSSPVSTAELLLLRSLQQLGPSIEAPESTGQTRTSRGSTGPDGPLPLSIGTAVASSSRLLARCLVTTTADGLVVSDGDLEAEGAIVAETLQPIPEAATQRLRAIVLQRPATVDGRGGFTIWNREHPAAAVV